MLDGESKVSLAFQKSGRTPSSEEGDSSWADIMAERESQGQATPVQEQREEEDVEGSFLAKTAEMIPAVGQGILKSVQETGNLALEASNGINKYLTEQGLGSIAGETDRELMSFADNPDLVYQPEYTAGKLTSAVANFMAPLGALNKTGKGIKAVSKIGKLAKAGTIGAMVDFAAFDPEEKRLSNLLRENFQFRDPVTEFLATNPKDSRAEGRLKNALEGLGLGLAIDGFMGTVKAYRANRVANNVIKDGGEVTSKMNQLDLPLEEIPQPKPDADGVAKELSPEDAATNKANTDQVDAALKTAKEEVKANRPSQQPIEDQLDMGFDKEVELKSMSDDELDSFLNTLDEAPIDGKVNRFNLDIIKNSDDMKRLLGAVAKRAGDPGYLIPNEVVLQTARKELAAGLGLTEEALLALPEGSVLNTTNMLQAKAILMGSAEYLGELTELVVKNPSEANKARFAMHLEKFGSIQRAFTEVGTETGRALEIRKTQLNLKGAAAENRYLEDVVKIAGGSDQIDDVLEAISGLKGAKRTAALAKASRGLTDGKSAGELARELWIHGLLSGPSTQVGNFVTNTLNYGMAPLQRAFTELSSRGFGNTATSISKGETAAMLSQMTDLGTYGDAFRLFNKTRKTGKSSFAGGTKIDIETGLSSSARGWDPNGFAGKTIDFLSPYIRWGNRYLTAADDFAKHLNYQQEVAALAHRKGKRAQLAGGLTDEQTRAFIDDAMRNPDKSIKHGAFAATQERTLTKDLADVRLPFADDATVKTSSSGFQVKSQNGLEAMEEFIKKSPVLRVIAPFTKISMNMTEYALNRTPFAKGLKADMVAGGLKRDAALGRIAVGGSAMGLAYKMTTDGFITGGGPSDPAARKTLEASGWQAESIQIGGKSIKLDTLGPIGTLLKIGAKTAEISGAIGRDQEGDLQDVMMQTMFALAELSTPEFILGSFGDLLDATNDEKALERLVSNLAGSVIPSGVKSITKLTDNTKRDTMGDPNAMLPMLDKMLNNLQRSIPGLSSDLPAVRNVFGEPQKNHYSLTGDNPEDVIMGGGPKDAVSKFIQEMNLTGQDPVEGDENLDYLKITKPPKTISITRSGISSSQKLSPKQYDRLLELSGGHGLEDASFEGLNLRDKLNQEIREDFPSLGGSERTPMARILVINSIVSTYKKAAKAQLIEEDFELRESVMDGFKNQAEKVMGGEVNLNL